MGALKRENASYITIKLTSSLLSIKVTTKLLEPYVMRYRFMGHPIPHEISYIPDVIVNRKRFEDRRFER